MCGICGIVGEKAESKDDLVRSMMKALVHRGPDGEGLYKDKDICLGHRRLKVIDLSEKAKQPMFNEDGNIVIIHNGEVFNYIELREELKKLGHKFKSSNDTEVIIHGYEEWGIEFLNKLNGMFSFALYDRKEKKCILVRDRFGIKPLYWTINEGVLFFASEIKPLLKKEIIKAKVNDNMVFDYLVFARVDHTEQTFFKDIFRLKPGHMIKYSNDKLIIKKWWHLKTEKNVNINFLNLLDNAVELRLRSDVSIGSSLSGGLDSSSIMTIMRKKMKEIPLYSFSAVHDKNWEKDEKKYIDIMVEQLNLKGKTVKPKLSSLLEEIDNLIYHQEEPFGSPSVYASWKVMELAHKNKIKVILNGQGGDEILAGYPYFTTYYLRELIGNGHLFKFFKETCFLIKRERDFFPLKLFFFLILSKKFKKKALQKKMQVINNEFFNNKFKNSRVIEDFIDAPNLNKAIINHLEFKLEHLLRYEDKNAMAFSIETRLPFLDYRLVEYMVAQPAEIKIKDGIQKKILRDNMDGILPDYIRLRKDKVGFEIPEYEWYQDKKFKQFYKKYANKKMKTIKYYDSNKLKKLISNYLKGKKGNERILWRILNLELWYRRFIESEIIN